MPSPPFPDNTGELSNPTPQNPDPRADYAAEANRLTSVMMTCFWHDDARMFKVPLLSAETVRSSSPTQSGYLFWPSITALHALAAAEWYSRFIAGAPAYESLIASVYDGWLDRYFDPGMQAYNAWLHFPGNNDKYYDDNALAVFALVDCTLATDDVRYMDQAWKIMANFVFDGWDPSGSPGGVTWGVDPSKPKTSMKAVSATAFAALAAFRLAAYYPQYHPGVTYFDRQFMTDWGYNALEWIWTKVRDTDGLVQDGLEQVGAGWIVSPIKWTYNTGVTMRAYVDHYQLTGNTQSLAHAKSLADAALRAGANSAMARAKTLTRPDQQECAAVTFVALCDNIR